MKYEVCKSNTVRVIALQRSVDRRTDRRTDGQTDGQGDYYRAPALRWRGPNYTFDLESCNLQGQGHKQRSQWKELMKVYLHLMCERVIDHCLGTMKLYINYTFDLETRNLQGQGHRQRSRWKELIKVHLHLKC